MNILVRGARQLLTLRGPSGPRRGDGLRELGLIQDGALLIQDGVIQEVGPSRRVENLTAARGAQEINATGRVVMPGFVDSHTHLVYGPSWLEEYEARRTGAPADFLSPPDLQATFRSIQKSSARRVEARSWNVLSAMVRHGTTSLEAKSGFGVTNTAEVKILRVLKKLDGRPVDVTPTCLAARWSDEHEGSNQMEWLCSRLLPNLHKRKLARFADIRCDWGTFSLEQARRYLEAAAAIGYLLKVHAGEGTPPGFVQLAVEQGAVSADHLESASGEDVDILGDSQTIATLAPACTYYRGTRGAPARELIDRGAAVALASDLNPHTSPTCSMQMVIALACSELKMTPAEAVVAATINGAHAISRGGQVGSLEPGKYADLIILNASDYREIPYRFGWNQVHLTMKRGTIVYQEGVVARTAGAM
jgi:imidazolonepropionase